MHVALLVASVCAVPAPQTGASASTELDEVEALVEEIGPDLDSFEEWIRTGAALSLTGDATILGVADASPETTQRGRLRVERATPAQDPNASLDELRAALVRGEPERVHSKVVGIDSEPDEGRATARLRVEVSGAGWQVVAHLLVELEVEAYVAIPERGLLASRAFRSLALDGPVEAVLREGEPLFVERTAGVFAGATEAARLLGVGSDRWAQRLDDPALSAWFGHQGLAAGDVNGDGREDLYVAMPSGLPNLLLLQQEDGSVRDAASEAGVAWLDDTKGVMLVDVDADGRLDVVSALGHVIAVQRNDGEGRFPVAAVAVAPDEAPFYGISAADIDEDGDLDLFGARYVRTHYADTVPVPFEDARNGPSNHLFRNDAGRFVDVTQAMGLAEPGGRFSLQGVFVDFDVDGDADLYVVNDFGRNQMFVLENGRYEDRAAALGIEDQGAGMGASWSDFDRDGDLDLYVSNMFSSAGRRVAFQPGFGAGRDAEQIEGIRRFSLGNSLFVRRGSEFASVPNGLHFDDRSDAMGVRMGRWAWGAVFCDLDADGYDDLVSPAGFLTGPEPGDL